MNIIMLLQGINFLLFLLLGGIHVYWAIAGTWGAAFAIPTTSKGIPVFQPRKTGTLLVGGCLIVAALLNGGWINLGLWTNFGIGLLFGLRVMGDFTYVGIFKKVKNTAFAQKDATVFIPLCIYLSLAHLLLFYL